MLLSFVTLLLAAAGSTLAQDDPDAVIKFDIVHNTTTIIGTWSSGSKGVVTGAGFANPAAYSFEYPKTTGISYSFSEDGYFEEAQYRFQSNATDPRCVSGIVRFQHGKYQLLNNGSIVMEPIPEDGRIQIQAKCPTDGISNAIYQFNTTVFMRHWRIFTDLVDGPKLHLFQFDGAPLAPMFLVQKEPLMLPKLSLVQQAINASIEQQTKDQGKGKSKREYVELVENFFGKRSAAGKSASVPLLTTTVQVTGLTLTALMSIGGFLLL
jgi:hypothetical protein